MADLCASILVVLGAAWVVRHIMDGSTRQPLTAVRRRRWVFFSLLSAMLAHGALAGLDVIAWRSIAVPAIMLGSWVVLCRMMVRPPRVARGASLVGRLSPAPLALCAATVLAAWVALNPLGDRPDEAVAAAPAVKAAVEAPSEADPAQVPVARVEPAAAASSGLVMATRGAIVYVGDKGHLTANTGATSSSGAVALGVDGSDLRSGDSGDSGEPGGVASASRKQSSASREQSSAARSSRRTLGHENGTLAQMSEGRKGGRSTVLSGFEDHSVSVDGDDQIVTYDDSNVFIDRKGLINANTGDTDSSGLNAVDVAGSTVRAGNSGDREGDEADDVAEEALSPATSGNDERTLSSQPAARAGAPASTAPTVEDPDDAEENGEDQVGVRPLPGQAYGTVADEGDSTATGKNSFVVGADGFDDVSIRSHGRNDIVTYDDSNVTIGGEGKVNAQIGDSDTGGAVVMGIHDSDARAGCEGDLCYSANPALTLAAQILGSSGVQLSPRQWHQLVSYMNQEYSSGHTPAKPGVR